MMRGLRAKALAVPHLSPLRGLQSTAAPDTVSGHPLSRAPSLSRNGTASFAHSSASGYAEAEFSDLLEGESNVSFLPKPIDIKTLAETVKDRLRPEKVEEAAVA